MFCYNIIISVGPFSTKGFFLSHAVTLLMKQGTNARCNDIVLQDISIRCQVGLTLGLLLLIIHWMDEVQKLMEGIDWLWTLTVSSKWRSGAELTGNNIPPVTLARTLTRTNAPPFLSARPTPTALIKVNIVEDLLADISSQQFCYMHD